MCLRDIKLGKYKCQCPECYALDKPNYVCGKLVPYTKGHLISELIFDILNFPKNQQKIWQISALEYKKLSNQQNKGTYL